MQYLLTAAFLLFAILPTTKVLKSVIETQPYLGKDEFDELTELAKKQKGAIITSGIKGIGNYNPQLRTERSIMLPGPIQILGPNEYFYVSYNNNIKIYCIDLLDPTAILYPTDKLKKCFTNRTLEEWKKIKEEFKATNVMTAASWQLQLPLLKSAGGISLYTIP